MRQVDRFRSVVVAAQVVLALPSAAAVPAVTSPADTVTPRGSAVQVRFRSQAKAAIAHKAVAGALARLSSPTCRAVLSEFVDGSGVRLDERMAETGGSVEAWVSGIFFYDGSAQATCQKRRVMAVTSPGSHVVFLCPEFTRSQRSDSGLAEVIVIHELLHTLGLEENPPSSLEINRRVIDRCGR